MGGAAIIPKLSSEFCLGNGNPGHPLGEPWGTPGHHCIWIYSGSFPRPQNERANLHKDDMINKIENKTNLSVAGALAEFTAGLRWDDLPAEVVQRLKELLLDWIGVTSAASAVADSSEPIVKGILNFVGAASGANTVLNRGRSFNARTAALINGAFSHSFDFDDTHSRGCLHPGAPIIAATLAQAEELQSPAQDVIVALAVGYEVVCRIAVQLGDLSYERGFHNTGVAGIFGCVAAICALRHTSASIVENALGLAGSKASGSMSFLENGSWNKRLHPGFAAHDAFLCVSLAEAGVIGSAPCFEGRHGVFHAYSSKPNDFRVAVADLGDEWEFMTTALKPFPACRMTHGAIDLVGQLASSNKGRSFNNIEVRIRPSCYDIVGTPVSNKVHPQNIVDAQFSMYYQVAVAWLDGSWTGWQAYEKLHDLQVHEVCDKVTVIGEDGLSGLETKMVVSWDDGSTQDLYLYRPLGEAENPFTKAGIDAKFLSLTRSVYGENRAKKIKDLVDGFENSTIEGLMGLVQ